MTRFYVSITMGMMLMIAGCVIAIPTDDVNKIIFGASLCWISLPCFWLASKFQ